MPPVPFTADHSPALVAHRGYAGRFPENSLEAIEAALQAGARYVEFDLHLSADHEPVVIHDAQLKRTTGVEGLVHETPLAELRRLEANEKARFGETYTGVRIPTLEEMIQLLRAWPEVTAFVELKRAGLNHFGIETVVERVMALCEPIADRAVPISFNPEAVAAARRRDAPAVGWVFEEWRDENRDIAAKLAPDYLFCDWERLPPAPAPLWTGPWRWALYEVTDPDLALALARRGAEFIETMEIGKMVARLGPGGAVG